MEEQEEVRIQGAPRESKAQQHNGTGIAYRTADILGQC